MFKNHLFSKGLLIVLFFTTLLTSCKELKMSNEEAEKLIKNSLNLPQKINMNIEANVSNNYAFGCLKDAGYLSATRNWNPSSGSFGQWEYYVEVLDNAKPYLIEENQQTGTFVFKINDIIFDKITGISIDKNNNTSLVRFNLKIENVTPIGSTLQNNGQISYSLNDPIQAELTFKKFDNGWQLESNQGLSPDELCKKIIQK